MTSKARNTDTYQAYLEEAGTDGNLHYDIKIQASRILLDNVQYTFTTPVFNGSASLRDAAGQLIEKVTKSVRRKETIDDAYMEKLFADVTALYRLDQKQGGAAYTEDSLGPLPAASKALLAGLCGVWVLILGYLAWDYRRRSS